MLINNEILVLEDILEYHKKCCNEYYYEDNKPMFIVEYQSI